LNKQEQIQASAKTESPADLLFSAEPADQTKGGPYKVVLQDCLVSKWQTSTGE
jgi:hypothetical protein